MDCERFFILGACQTAHDLHLILAGAFRSHFFGYFSNSDKLERDPSTAFLIRPLKDHIDDLGPGDYLFLSERNPPLEEILANAGVRLGFPHNLVDIHRTHESPVLLEFLDRHFPPQQHQGTSLDIGANFGQTATILSARFKWVHAFEPNRTIFSNLANNPTLPANIVLHELALGRTLGTVGFFDQQGTNGTACASAGEPDYNVEVDTLDHVCQRLNIIPSFIKIDAEGLDADVILGGKLILQTHRPILYFENPLSGQFNTDLWSKTRDFLEPLYELQAYQCLNKLFKRHELGMALSEYRKHHSLEPLNIAAIPR